MVHARPSSPTGWQPTGGFSLGRPNRSVRLGHFLGLSDLVPPGVFSSQHGREEIDGISQDLSGFTGIFDDDKNVQRANI